MIEVLSDIFLQELEAVSEEWLIRLDWCINTGGEHCDWGNCMEQNVNPWFAQADLCYNCQEHCLKCHNSWIFWIRVGFLVN
jgi:hypothetical protein